MEMDENIPRKGLGEGERAGEFEYDRCVCLPPCGRILFYMGTLPPLPQPEGSAAEPLLRQGAMNPSPASPVRTNAPVIPGDGAAPPHPDPPLLGLGLERGGGGVRPLVGTGRRHTLVQGHAPSPPSQSYSRNRRRNPPPPLPPLPRKPFASFTRACASKRRVRRAPVGSLSPARAPSPPRAPHPGCGWL